MSENAEAFRAESLQIEASQDRNGATITLMGEFDMTGTERFWSFLSEALAATPRTIVVDTSALEFIDSSGLVAELLRSVGTIRRAQSGCQYPYASGRRCV